MNISNIITIFNDMGFKVKKMDMPDLAYYFEQKWTLKVPDSEIKERNNISYTIHYDNDIRNYFSVFEDCEVNSDGINYCDPNKFHYFYSFGTEISKIYHQDDISNMFDDLINDMSSILKLDQLREVKLRSIGV